MPKIELDYQGTTHVLEFSPSQTDRKYVERLISEQWGLSFDQFSLTYLDSEGDQITTDIQEDFEVARVTMTGDEDLLKFKVNLNPGVSPHFKEKIENKVQDPFSAPSQNDTCILSVKSSGIKEEKVNQIPKEEQATQIVQHKIQNEEQYKQIQPHIKLPQIEVAQAQIQQKNNTQDQKQPNQQKVEQKPVSSVDAQAKLKKKEEAEAEAKKKAEAKAEAKRKAQEEAAQKKKIALQAKKQAEKIKEQERQRKQAEKKQNQRLKAVQRQKLMAKKLLANKQTQKKSADKKEKKEKQEEKGSHENSADKKQSQQKSLQKIEQLKSKQTTLTEEKVKQLVRQEIQSMIPELKQKILQNQVLKGQVPKQNNGENACRVCNANLSINTPFYFNSQNKTYLCSQCESKDQSHQVLIKIRNPKHFEEIDFIYLSTVSKNQLNHVPAGDVDKLIQETKVITINKIKQQLKIKSNELKKAKQVEEKKKQAEEKKKQMIQQKRLQQEAKKLSEAEAKQHAPAQ